MDGWKFVDGGFDSGYDSAKVSVPFTVPDFQYGI